MSPAAKPAELNEIDQALTLGAVTLGDVLGVDDGSRFAVVVASWIIGFEGRICRFAEGVGKGIGWGGFLMGM